MKFHGGGMNMRQYRTSYQYAFNQSLPQFDRPNLRTEFVAPLSKNSQPELMQLHRIHSKEASMAVFKNKPSGYQHLQLIEKAFDQAVVEIFQPPRTGSINVDVRRPLQIRQGTSQTVGCQTKHSLSEGRNLKNKVDHKVKRMLSQQSRNNFLQFLLIQKAGQKDEKQMFDFLQKEYNYQLPQPIDLTKINKPISKRVKKQGIMYLQNRDETEEALAKQVQQVLNSKRSKGRDDTEPESLDEFIIKTHEKNTRSLKIIKKGRVESKVTQNNSDVLPD